MVPFERSLKGEAWRFSADFARSDPVRALWSFPVQRLLFHLLAIRILPTAHSSSCSFSFTSYKEWQWRKRTTFNLLPIVQCTFWSKHLTFMNLKRRNKCSAPLKLALGVSHRYWLSRKDAHCTIAKDWTRAWRIYSSSYSKGALNFRHVRHGNCVPNCKSMIEEAQETLKGSHRMGLGRNSHQASATLSLIRTYRMTLFSGEI
jgi:hypothetical protein